MRAEASVEDDHRIVPQGVREGGQTDLHAARGGSKGHAGVLGDAVDREVTPEMTGGRPPGAPSRPTLVRLERATVHEPLGHAPHPRLSRLVQVEGQAAAPPG